MREAVVENAVLSDARGGGTPSHRGPPRELHHRRPDTQPSHRETAAVAAAEAAEAAESTRDMRRRACSPLSTAGAASASPSQRQRGGTMETGAPSLRSQLLARAPMVESGQFLETWDRSHLPTNARGLELENHWGRVDTEATVSVERMAELAVGLQASYYVPPLPAVAAPACRAPVGAGGGRLCSRRDSVRCPFHGPIVPRDDQGQPLQPLARELPSAPAALPSCVCPTFPTPGSRSTGRDSWCGSDNTQSQWGLLPLRRRRRWQACRSSNGTGCTTRR
jgi:hypothetical protein